MISRALTGLSSQICISYRAVRDSIGNCTSYCFQKSSGFMETAGQSWPCIGLLGKLWFAARQLLMLFGLRHSLMALWVAHIDKWIKPQFHVLRTAFGPVVNRQFIDHTLWYYSSGHFTYRSLKVGYSRYSHKHGNDRNPAVYMRNHGELPDLVSVLVSAASVAYAQMRYIIYGILLQQISNNLWRTRPVCWLSSRRVSSHVTPLGLFSMSFDAVVPADVRSTDLAWFLRNSVEFLFCSSSIHQQSSRDKTKCRLLEKLDPTRPTKFV